MFYRLINAYSRQFSFPFRGLKYFLRAARWFNIADKVYTKKLSGKFYMQLNPTEHIQQQLFWYGNYEKELGDLISRVLKPGDLFLDIGANIGYFSLLASAKEPLCKIIAFEPAPNIYKKLEENISLNNFKNIRIVNAAAGEVSGENDLFISGPDNLGMSSFKQPENFSGEIEKVKTVSIDDWVRVSGLHKLDLVKIDIEGSELSALKGMKTVLANFKPLLLIEINPETLAMFSLKATDIFYYLNQFNFSAYEISEGSKLIKREHVELAETKNFLFIHPDKKELYSELLAR